MFFNECWGSNYKVQKLLCVGMLRLWEETENIKALSVSPTMLMPETGLAMDL